MRSVSQRISYMSRIFSVSVLGVSSLTLLSVLNTSEATSASTVLRSCTYGQLEVAVAWGPGGFAGTEASPFLIANTGSTACSLKGYPVVRFYTSLPTVAKVKVVHQASQIFAEPKAKLIVIQPGRDASFGLSYTDAFIPKSDVAKDCVTNTVYVTLPVVNSGGQSYEDNLIFDLCQSDMTVAVTPIEVGPSPRNR